MSIDSRTGLTDIGGICTVHLPDMVVSLATATNQSLGGILKIARRAASARDKLPFPRPITPTLPVPSRFDTKSEYRLGNEWLSKFAEELQPLVSDWLPKSITARQFLDAVKLPHVSFFSYGESLPVVNKDLRIQVDLVMLTREFLLLLRIIWVI